LALIPLRDLMKPQECYCLSAVYPPIWVIDFGPGKLLLEKRKESLISLKMYSNSVSHGKVIDKRGHTDLPPFLVAEENVSVGIREVHERLNE
jgi:hypothetical protein